MLKICVLEDEAAQMERMKAYLQNSRANTLILSTFWMRTKMHSTCWSTTNGMLTFFFSTFVCRT